MTAKQDPAIELQRLTNQVVFLLCRDGCMYKAQAAKLLSDYLIAHGVSKSASSVQTDASRGAKLSESET